ncbi:uncharacterized protein ChaoS9_240 [Halobacterium phage ChaoS9]|uniref:DUF6788 domain-containing protein n=1 Tax=Halobacterium phage ChaoS9 TaxID=2847105 RepID=A0A481V9G4_9CAUD|nr:uncharacterized protein KMC41_gp49 [Halobacterium phage ChaoS9]QBI90053.1 uncharacterized protein ChaoS9_240 [Halobacterium phage ChaoS9]
MATSPTPTPEPPASIPQYILNGLDRQDAQTLEEISRYAEDLAEAKAAQAEAELEDGDEEVVREDSEDVDDLPDDVPTKASVVVKEINSNRYYYYQWREGSKVKSKYKAPVNPDSDD